VGGRSGYTTNLEGGGEWGGTDAGIVLDLGLVDVGRILNDTTDVIEGDHRTRLQETGDGDGEKSLGRDLLNKQNQQPCQPTQTTIQHAGPPLAPGEKYIRSNKIRSLLDSKK